MQVSLLQLDFIAVIIGDVVGGGGLLISYTLSELRNFHLLQNRDRTFDW